jgi:hypothetical protein
VAGHRPSVCFLVDAASRVSTRHWPHPTGEEVAVLRGHEGGVRSAAFGPDGKRIVTASDDNTARVWDAATGEEIAVPRGHVAVLGHMGIVAAALMHPWLEARQMMFAIMPVEESRPYQVGRTPPPGRRQPRSAHQGQASSCERQTHNCFVPAPTRSPRGRIRRQRHRAARVAWRSKGRQPPKAGAWSLKSV